MNNVRYNLYNHVNSIMTDVYNKVKHFDDSFDIIDTQTTQLNDLSYEIATRH